jgi:hypothetical protein
MQRAGQMGESSLAVDLRPSKNARSPADGSTDAPYRGEGIVSRRPRRAIGSAVRRSREAHDSESVRCRTMGSSRCLIESVCSTFSAYGVQSWVECARLRFGDGDS